MARNPRNSSPDVVVHGPHGNIAVVEVKRVRRRARVKVGDVFIFGDKAFAAEVKQAVQSSAAALDRMSEKISKPGVRLPTRKDIPLFSLDPENPDRIVRKLNGRIERGIFADGQFKVQR